MLKSGEGVMGPIQERGSPAPRASIIRPERRPREVGQTRPNYNIGHGWERDREMVHTRGNRRRRLKEEPIFIGELGGEIVYTVVESIRCGEVDVLAPSKFRQRMRHVLPERFSR